LLASGTIETDYPIKAAYIGNTYSPMARWCEFDLDHNPFPHDERYDKMFPLLVNFGWRTAQWEREMIEELKEDFFLENKSSGGERPGKREKGNVKFVYLCIKH